MTSCQALVLRTSAERIAAPEKTLALGWRRERSCSAGEGAKTSRRGLQLISNHSRSTVSRATATQPGKPTFAQTRSSDDGQGHRFLEHVDDTGLNQEA